MMSDAAADHQRMKARSRLRAERRHQGPGHWHVDIRSTVIVCRACGAKVPKYLSPRFCPACDSGRDTLPSVALD
jgi:rubrerythrin